MKSGEHFDVIIIGAGPSGIFCAYELIKEKPELNILMEDQSKNVSVQREKQKYALAVNHVPSPQASQEPELSPTENSPSPRMSEEICRRS